MKKQAEKIICAALALALALGCLSACGNRRSTQNRVPLRVGVSELKGNFSPFFAASDGDAAVAALTQESLLTLDRSGAVIYDAINGQTGAYDGTEYSYTGLASVAFTRDNENDLTSYTFTLRPDVKFSGGEAVDIDDLIFSLYVFLDPSYDGRHTISELPIVGLRDYRTRTTGEVYEKYGDLFDGIYSGRGEFTDEELSAWEAVVIRLWDSSGLAGSYDSARVYWKNVGTSGNELYEAARHEFISALGPDDPALALNSVRGISGIERLSDNELKITLNGYDPDDIYAMDIPVAPLHYYGDLEKYNYEAFSFGFDYGDLSEIKDKSSVPRGAGPYRLSGYQGGTAYLEYNPGYWRGRANTARIELIETTSPVSDLNSELLDLATPDFDAPTEVAIRAANENGELTADRLTTVTLAGPDYWFIGINARNVSAGDAGGEASKNLRRALATVFSACRERAASELFGSRAALPGYPASIASLISQYADGSNFAEAFSRGLDGQPIYSRKMSDDERVAAALAAAVDYFVAAGYKYENGRLVSAPEGASVVYNVFIPTGDYATHPAYATVGYAKEALSGLGISLLVATVTDAELAGVLDSGLYDIWCGYRSHSNDPKLYEAWGPNSANLWGIRDSEFSKVLERAGSGVSQTERAELYVKSLEVVTDWAVEVPLYQSLDCLVYLTEAIAYMPPGLTQYYGWTDCVIDIKMRT